MIKIYVGDITDDLQIFANSNDSDATLITDVNYKTITDGSYYVSLGDLKTIRDFLVVLSCADILIYSPPNKWSDDKNGFSYMQYWTELYLNFFKSRKQVIGLTDTNIEKFLLLADERKSVDPQLWVVGCSISHGEGVTSDERYGEILSKELRLPTSFLTFPGSSIEWAADQILRSDIKCGDTIVWGLTSIDRFSYFDTKLRHINSGYSKKHKDFDKNFEMLRMEGDDLLYRSLICIHQVLNYCHGVGARLYFAGILITLEISKYFVNLPNYIQFYGYPSVDYNNLFIDIGSDNIHPGPMTHQWYAKDILNLINQNIYEDLK